MASVISVRTPGRVQPEPPAEARLALVEYLLASDDAVQCAERALEWLSEHTGVRHSLFAWVDPGTSRLVSVADFPHRGAEFSVDLEQRDHPLVAAFHADAPVVVRPPMNGARSQGPFGRAPFTAMPLYVPETAAEARAGLLLLSPAGVEQSSAVRWLAEVLAQKLVRLGYIRALGEAEVNLGRELTLINRVLNAVPDPLLLTDTEGRMILANSRAEALFTSTEAESEGRRRAVALNNMFLSAALSQRAIEGSEATRREVLLVDPSDGSDLLFELMSTVANDPRQGTGIVSVLRNVTDLRRATEEIEANYGKIRQAEARVRAERDWLDLIINSVADPILVTDAAGSLVLMNTPAERLFTAAPASASAEVQRAVRANDAQISSFVSNLFLGGADPRRKGQLTLTDPGTGASVHVEAVAGNIIAANGEVTTVTILHDRAEAMEKARLYEQLKKGSEQLEEKVSDATAELVRQNELLRRQSIEIERASAAKSQFFANMSHEFRTPLNAILGYTQNLLHGVAGELHPQQRRNLGRVDSNARQLLSIINDILDLARLESGKMPVRLETFTLRDLVAEVVAEVDPIIARTTLEVTTEIPADLPAVASDRQKVKQIVLNLLTNALKFTPQGWVRVTASFDRTADEVAVAVTDSGIGIAAADQEKIFEEFRQADNSTTREYGGTGLGLAISRRLATILDGRVNLVSKVGEGSTFTLLLPRRPKRRGSR